MISTTLDSAAPDNFLIEPDPAKSLALTTSASPVMKIVPEPILLGTNLSLATPLSLTVPPLLISQASLLSEA